MNERQVDRLFKALSDKTRRRMVDVLAKEAKTTGALAEMFPGVSRFAVMKHLGVLERAGLIAVTRAGRVRWNRLNVVPLRDVLRRWVGRYEGLWSEVLLNVRDMAEAAERESDL